MSGADLVVELDLAVRRDRTVERRLARHALRGQSVHVLESNQGGVRARWVDVRAWPAALADTLVRQELAFDGAEKKFVEVR